MYNVKNKIRKAIYLLNKGILVVKTDGFTALKLKVTKYFFTKYYGNNSILINNLKVDAPLIIKDTSAEKVSFATYMNRELRDLQQIPFMYFDSPKKRVNLVTDSIEDNSLLGGVGTALIIVSQLACNLNLPLRIITRHSAGSARNYSMFLKTIGQKIPADVSFYSDFNRDIDGNIDNKLEVSRNDIFFATSWWSAYAIKNTFPKKHFFYIIQEVEKFFYPQGYMVLLCEQIMNDSNISYIVNSRWLFDYFKSNEPNITRNGLFFDPAFPKTLYKPTQSNKNKKRKFFFYSRPNNPRNLFLHGLDVIDKCLIEGILDTEEFDIYFLGQETPEIVFSNGYQPKMLGLLSWQKYAKFISEVDLAISLMYTPHPSYPPLDVASSGGVVVTNRYLNKISIEWCKNIIFCELDTDSLIKGVDQGIHLTKDVVKKRANFESSTIPSSWDSTLIETNLFLKEIIENVYSK